MKINLDFTLLQLDPLPEVSSQPTAAEVEDLVGKLSNSVKQGEALRETLNRNLDALTDFLKDDNKRESRASSPSVHDEGYSLSILKHLVKVASASVNGKKLKLSRRVTVF